MTCSNAITYYIAWIKLLESKTLNGMHEKTINFFYKSVIISHLIPK
jgi:hypothetical protein